MYSPEILMPCSTDLKEIIGILIARTLSKYMPEFAVFQDAVVDHIPHKYSSRCHGNRMWYVVMYS